jgi:hypothetical protein
VRNGIEPSPCTPGRPRWPPGPVHALPTLLPGTGYCRAPGPTVPRSAALKGGPGGLYGCHDRRADGPAGSLHTGCSDALPARRTRQGPGHRRDAEPARCRRTLVTLMHTWLHLCHRAFGVTSQVAPSPHQGSNARGLYAADPRDLSTLDVSRTQRRVRRHRRHSRSSVLCRAQGRGCRAGRLPRLPHGRPRRSQRLHGNGADPAGSAA